MPKYSYQCASCKTLFEREMTITEKKTACVQCPACGSGDVARSFAGVSVHVGKSAPERVTGCDANPSCPGCAMHNH